MNIYTRYNGQEKMDPRKARTIRTSLGVVASPRCPWNKYTAICAAVFGHFDILKWAIVNVCPLSESLCHIIVRYHNLELLILAKENNCPWNYKTTLAAKIYGYKSIYDWAIKNGCPGRKRGKKKSVDDIHSVYEDSIDEEDF
jgi:hypothetical protein